MKGTKYAKPDLEGINEDALAELFPDSGGHQLITLTADTLAAIGRIIGYTGSLGGTCTFYYSSRDNCLGLSLRVAERQRSLLLVGDDADATFCEQLANGFARIYLEREQLRAANKLAQETSKGKKKGK